MSNTGVYGAPVTFHIEKLWGYSIGELDLRMNIFTLSSLTPVAITIGFINTSSTETLMKMY